MAKPFPRNFFLQVFVSVSPINSNKRNAWPISWKAVKKKKTMDPNPSTQQKKNQPAHSTTQKTRKRIVLFFPVRRFTAPTTQRYFWLFFYYYLWERLRGG